MENINLTNLDLEKSTNGLEHERTNSRDARDEPQFSEELLYQVEDVPPWHMCLFLGLQNYLQMIGSTVANPFFLTPALCMADNDPDKANIISTLVFMCGIITLLQCTFGSRLPIVQGGSFSYLIPSLAILKLPQWQCPTPEEFDSMSPENRTELWQVRMREVQGASLFEVFFAFTDLVGLLSKYFTPLSISPSIFLLGISLFKEATAQASKNYTVAAVTLLLLIFFSQYLRNIRVPLMTGKAKKPGCSKKETFPVFQAFHILMAISIVWITCAILTMTDVLQPGNPARTDSKLAVITAAPWFRIPYPFQWGWPTVSLGAVLGITCGVIATTVESVGDYCACATISKKPTPPQHAINRGIFAEGFGSFLSGIWGSGNGSTSYSINIGTIALTKAASRRVVQVAGTIMIIMGLIGKAGGVFVSLPDPIMAGMFMYLFPLIIAMSLGMLADVSLKSGRNLFIVSFSIFTGLSVSQWVLNNPGIIQTGSDTTDSVIRIFLTTGMFIGGLIGFILDNTVPGTDDERGITQKLSEENSARVSGDNTYDLPFGMGWISKCEALQWFPLSPSYNKHVLEILPCCKASSRPNIRGNKDHLGEYTLSPVADGTC